MKNEQCVACRSVVSACWSVLRRALFSSMRCSDSRCDVRTVCSCVYIPLLSTAVRSVCTRERPPAVCSLCCEGYCCGCWELVGVSTDSDGERCTSSRVFARCTRSVSHCTALRTYWPCAMCAAMYGDVASLAHTSTLTLSLLLRGVAVSVQRSGRRQAAPLIPHSAAVGDCARHCELLGALFVRTPLSLSARKGNSSANRAAINSPISRAARRQAEARFSRTPHTERLRSVQPAACATASDSHCLSQHPQPRSLLRSAPHRLQSYYCMHISRL